MSAALLVADGAIAIAEVWLIAICVRRQDVLGGVAAAGGLTLLAFAALRGVSGGAAHAALGFALVFLILGAALVGLGQVLQHLLDDPSDEPDS